MLGDGPMSTADPVSPSQVTSRSPLPGSNRRIAVWSLRSKSPLVGSRPISSPDARSVTVHSGRWAPVSAQIIRSPSVGTLTR